MCPVDTLQAPTHCEANPKDRGGCGETLSAGKDCIPISICIPGRRPTCCDYRTGVRLKNSQIFTNPGGSHGSQALQRITQQRWRNLASAYCVAATLCLPVQQYQAEASQQSDTELSRHQAAVRDSRFHLHSNVWTHKPQKVLGWWSETCRGHYCKKERAVVQKLLPTSIAACWLYCNAASSPQCCELTQG